jgi:hypothetical protein
VWDGLDEGAWVVAGVAASNQSPKFGVAASNQSSKLKNSVGDTEGTGLLLDASSSAEDEDARVQKNVYKRNLSSQRSCCCGWLENDDDLMVLFFLLFHSKILCVLRIDFVRLLFGFWVLGNRYKILSQDEIFERAPRRHNGMVGIYYLLLTGLYCAVPVGVVDSEDNMKKFPGRFESSRGIFSLVRPELEVAVGQTYIIHHRRKIELQFLTHSLL